jgi:hypothetical protein
LLTSKLEIAVVQTKIPLSEGCSITHVHIVVCTQPVLQHNLLELHFPNSLDMNDNLISVENLVYTPEWQRMASSPILNTPDIVDYLKAKCSPRPDPTNVQDTHIQ